MIKAVRGRVLNGEELTGIGVVFHVAVRFDEEFVSDDETATPAGHVERLAGGMEFDPDVFCSGRREEAERLAFEDERGVGGVMNDDDVVLFREGDDLRKKLRRYRSSGRVVRVIDDQN